jgi:hypothetical protein
MKNKAVELYRWLPGEGEHIEIDWPKVHKTIGLEQTRWLLDQQRGNCQLMLEQRDDHWCKLIVEFYNEQTLLNYRLKWAK